MCSFFKTFNDFGVGKDSHDRHIYTHKSQRINYKIDYFMKNKKLCFSEHIITRKGRQTTDWKTMLTTYKILTMYKFPERWAKIHDFLTTPETQMRNNHSQSC